ncbi:MAG: hypothetical protein R2712_07350 [Vicinamibacterales bacterium]
MPPLRERAEDIPLLCSHFLQKFNRRYQKSATGIAPAAYQHDARAVAGQRA